MAVAFHLDIVSSEAKIFSGLVESLVAVGTEGELGIFPMHTPLLTRLMPGSMTLKLQNKTEEILYISGGFLEVQPKVVTVLADTVVRAQDLDEAAAMSAQERAKNILVSKQELLDYSKVLAELAEAAAQLRTIQKLRKKAGRK